MNPLVDEIDEPTPAGISAALGRLISSGRLAPGARLPTVRQLAGDLGVSPATVSHAWQAVSAAGLIVSRGRSGTFVSERAQEWLPARSKVMAGRRVDSRIDLSRGIPDPELLPALGPALSRISERAVTSSYQDLPVIPGLLDVLQESWPYPVDSITVVNGALDAISRSLDEVVRFGDRVIIENPTFPPFYDLLDQLGVERLPVPVDQHGLEPSAFAAALAKGPSAVILQPRAHNPTGASMTAARAEQLARMLQDDPRAAKTIVIEDDHSGQISTADDVSIGQWLPERVLHVRSYSKSHGPDLRIAALGGSAALVNRVVARRMLGPGWTSRMLQTILHDLLVDERSVAQVARARDEYATRQHELAEALSQLGVTTGPADGINTWLAVEDEHEAMLQLAASGIRVAGGTPFLAVDENQQPHVRVTVGAIRGEVREIAAALAATAAPRSAADRAPGARWA
ncbi:MAG: aminotransferase class I/II-fold pyridoxal phosphate-dependent enzyme [Salinibacterium sp.]|nr:aminotransferase class I/II-fold pyridoxal phosphate-dependent enzyme [Salinibacterium sp.]MBF0672453.1 aminotransferase class I/II-fold pyridoxal phosphate-dependent enzyme [Salinibacterium sp.]